MIVRWAGSEGDFVTKLPGVSLNRRELPAASVSAVYPPSVAFILQGRTSILIGGDEYLCGPGQHLITAVDLPTVYRIREASPERPFLSLMLSLDQKAIAQMLVDTEFPAIPRSGSGRSMQVEVTTVGLFDAVARLLSLLDEAEHIRALAPLIEREILYRLLVGELGGHLRQIAMIGSQGSRIARAITQLKGSYAQALRMEELAAGLSMGLSTFNHHFRMLTSMSPLQYQKQLRLFEARRLMIVEQLDAASAAHRVGYESPSQFSREYRRQFGAPPLRDIEQLRVKHRQEQSGRNV